MAKIHPFKGWRYDSEIIGDLTYVFVPPYDVITSEEQEQYYLNSPYSYIRINLNRNENEKRYSDAALKLQQWKNDSIINKEPDPALYILSQSFTHNGKVVDRVGCICELELSELGDTVLPHEQTIEKHLDTVSAEYPDTFWYYGNVYDPDDGTTPMLWWEEFESQE